MKRIGLLSDTHSTLSARVLNFFELEDEIWDANDTCDREIANRYYFIPVDFSFSMD
jgi:hypothetical protein